MSRQEIPWDKVAQEIVRTLGVETARGLLYAMMGQAVYPALAQFLQNLVSGRSKDEEVRRSLEEIKRMLQQQQPAMPTLQTPEEVSRALAVLLSRYGPAALSVQPPPVQPAQPTPQPSYAPTPPSHVPPELRWRAESLEMEVNALKRALSQLMDQYYAATDEAERKRLEEAIRQRQAELDNKRRELEYLRIQLRTT